MEEPKRTLKQLKIKFTPQGTPPILRCLPPLPEVDEPPTKRQKGRRTAVPTGRPSPQKGKRRLGKKETWQRYHDLPKDTLQRKWDSLWEEGRIEEVQYPGVETPCWQCHLATQGSGYIQLQLNGSSYGNQQGYYLLHLWSMELHGHAPASADFIDSCGLECSHLCHNKRCCNPAHLIFESNKTNKRRNVCPYKIDNKVVCKYIHDAPACLQPHYLFEKDGAALFKGYSIQ